MTKHPDGLVRLMIVFDEGGRHVKGRSERRKTQGEETRAARSALQRQRDGQGLAGKATAGLPSRSLRMSTRESRDVLSRLPRLTQTGWLVLAWRWTALPLPAPLPREGEKPIPRGEGLPCVRLHQPPGCLCSARCRGAHTAIQVLPRAAVR